MAHGLLSRFASLAVYCVVLKSHGSLDNKPEPWEEIVMMLLDQSLWLRVLQGAAGVAVGTRLVSEIRAMCVGGGWRQ